MFFKRISANQVLFKKMSPVAFLLASIQLLTSTDQCMCAYVVRSFLCTVNNALLCYVHILVLRFKTLNEYLRVKGTQACAV